MLVRIHNGKKERDLIIKEYEGLGSFEQIVAGAKVHCARMEETRGKDVWVRFLGDDVSTSRIFNEGKSESLTCPSCNLLSINGHTCHEYGCPDSHLFHKRSCKWCGSDFEPENRGQEFCEESCHSDYYS